jgi:hypothetical protein
MRCTPQFSIGLKGTEELFFTQFPMAGSIAHFLIPLRCTRFHGHLLGHYDPYLGVRGNGYISE